MRCDRREAGLGVGRAVAKVSRASRAAGTDSWCCWWSVCLSGLSQGSLSSLATLVLVWDRDAHDFSTRTVWGQQSKVESVGPFRCKPGRVPWLADLPTWMMGRTGAMRNGYKRQKCLASEAKMGLAGKRKTLGN